MGRVKTIAGLWVLLCLAGCGGGDGGSTGAAVSPAAASLSNFTTVTVDAGPASLQVGPNGYTQADVAYISVTLCAPGTSNCQTIDHVAVDTGSVGLRIAPDVLKSGLLSALPSQTDPAGNPVGECFGYVDGYVFGSVRAADVKIGGEMVSNMPLQVAGDAGPFSNAPSSCTSGGGTALNSVQALGSNGIIGIGITATDCGTYCATNGGYSAAIYYDCPAAGCGAIIARASSAVAPFQQLPNFVAALSIDNNGSILTLPAVASTGAASLTGTLYFGIGTQTNNALGSATVLTTTNSTSRDGPGLLTVAYKGQSLNESFIDSGSNLYFFVDDTITACADPNYVGYYCPSPPIGLSLTFQGLSGVTASQTLTLNNAQTLLSGSNSALPGIGGDTDLFPGLMGYPNSFDVGLPFFFGRSVYTAIEGRAAGGSTGPFIAF